MEEKRTYPTEWMGGRCKAHPRRVEKKRYHIARLHPPGERYIEEIFCWNKYGEEGAEFMAAAWLYEQALNRNLLKNQYRLIDPFTVEFVIQNRAGKMFFCYVDLEDFPKVEKHTWRVLQNRYAMTDNKKFIRLHHLIKPEFSIIDHIGNHYFIS